MNYKEIRRACIIMAVGYLFLTIFALTSLSSVGFKLFAQIIRFTGYVGFALVTVGSYLVIKEHGYYRGAFFSFLALDIILVAYIIIGNIFNTIPAEQKQTVAAFTLAMKILATLLDAALALSNGLYSNGMKEVFTKKKHKKMFVYSLIMEYGVTGLLLFSAVLGLIDFNTDVGSKIGLGFDITFNLLIQGSYAVYMIIIAHVLKEDIDCKNHKEHKEISKTSEKSVPSKKK